MNVPSDDIVTLYNLRSFQGVLQFLIVIAKKSLQPVHIGRGTHQSAHLTSFLQLVFIDEFINIDI